MKEILVKSLAVILTTIDLVTSQCTTISLVYGYAPETGQNGNNGFIENNRGAGNRYYRNESCGWQITVAKGATIRFVFQSIEMENSHNCDNDWVEIRDGFEFSKSLTGKLCNSSIVGRWYYTSDCVGFVYFQTNGLIERRGFTLYWEKISSSISESQYSDAAGIGDGKPPSAMTGNSSTTELQHASFSLIISITTVVGVTFGIVLVVITGILICVVFPKKQTDQPDKMAGTNFEGESKTTDNLPRKSISQANQPLAELQSKLTLLQVCEENTCASYDHSPMIVSK